MFSYFRSHWIDALREYISKGKPLVMVTVVNVEGSAPRESSSRMFVLDDEIVETIGGGNLELEAIKLAREMLMEDNSNGYRLELYGLGPALQQCCGGAVTLAFEKITIEPDWLSSCKTNNESDEILISEFGKSSVTRHIARLESLKLDNQQHNILIEKLYPLKPEVVIFGAGHVGAALVEVLGRLPFNISWVDEREDLFAGLTTNDVQVFSGKSAVSFIDDLPENALNIVMTHSHDLDEDICYQYLKKKEFRFLGLIGSKTKRARFLHRLRDRRIDQQQLSKLTCPIGVPEVAGSSPPEIAVAVAAQLLSERDRIKLDTSLS